METIVFYAAAITGIAAAITVIYRSVKKVATKGKSAYQKLSETADSLLGREAIVHPDTGEVLVEATPNLGTRLARIEGAVVQLADTSAAVVGLHTRVDSLERRVNRIEDVIPAVQVRDE